VACDLDCVVKVHVAVKFAVVTVDTYVDDDGAVLEHIGGDEMLFADGGDKNVGLAGDLGKVFGFGMANGHGAVFVKQEDGNGFADDVASTDDYGMFASHVDAGGFDKFNTACWRASGQTVLPAKKQRTSINGVKAVDVLFRVDVRKNLAFVQVLG